MRKIRKDAQAIRNAAIVTAWASCKRVKLILREFNISHGRLYQILKQQGIKAERAGNKIVQLDMFQ